MKMIPLYKQYENKPSKLAKCFTPFFSLHVLDFLDNGDTVVAAWQDGSGNYYDVRKSKVNYTEHGRRYIRKGNGRYYLDEFMRIS